MNISLTRWGTALMASLAIAGCGGGGGGSVAVPPTTGTAVNAAIVAAAALPGNDAASNTSSAFTVLQTAGVPAVTINSPPVVNFTVFSDGAVVQGLTAANVRVAMAKLVPAAGGNPDDWVGYVTRVKTAGSIVAVQATTDPTTSVTAAGAATVYPVDCASSTATLTYNKDGYYTYKFCTDVKQTKDAAGNLVFDASKTHRVALQLSYVNKAGVTVKVNPYFDFTLAADGTSVIVTDPSKTRKMTDVASCNSCHEKLALHGGGRVDTQFCVMCHNQGTTDAVTGKTVNLSTMIHKLHAGKRLAAVGDPYIVNDVNASEIGFPQDLRNCTKCHTAANAATPQGDNWKTEVSQQACLTCHSSSSTAIKTGQSTVNWYTSHLVFAKDAAVVGATAAAANTKPTDLTNAQCKACHVGAIAPETVHWNQNEENSVLYKMNIEDATYNAATRTVTVKYFVSNPSSANAAYNLVTTDCTTSSATPPVTTCSSSTKFGNLRFYVAYQTMVGQSASAVTEFSSYNNGGSGANAYAYKGTNDTNNPNHYSVDILLPADTATSVASGTARVVSIGQVKEPELALKSNATPRVPLNTTTPSASLVSVVIPNTYKDVVLTGTLQPRRAVVSAEKCNACHGSLGSTSGANTLANAFHGGARDTVEACAVCHDANRASTGNMMTNGLALYEPFQFKRMIHGIHGNSKRVNPFAHGNKVVGNFSKAGALTTSGIVFDDQYISTGTKARFITAGASAVGATSLAAGATFQTIADLMNAAATTAGQTGTFTTAAENYAAEVAYPGVGLNCNACHVNNSYKSDQGTLGTVVMKGITTAGTNSTSAVLEADPAKWLVISPKAASCTACHDSSVAIAHVTAFGGAAFGDKSQGVVAGLTGYTAAPRETCSDCHSSGSFKGVDVVHGQQ